MFPQLLNLIGFIKIFLRNVIGYCDLLNTINQSDSKDI